MMTEAVYMHCGHAQHNIELSVAIFDIDFQKCALHINAL